MEVTCSKCNCKMIIDEPNGIAYVTEGLIITRNADGIPTSIDESQKTIRHAEPCTKGGQ